MISRQSAQTSTVLVQLPMTMQSQSTILAVSYNNFPHATSLSKSQTPPNFSEKHNECNTSMSQNPPQLSPPSISSNPDVADQPRISHHFTMEESGQVNNSYQPQVHDKWWSLSNAEWQQNLTVAVRRNKSHIARIMETNLGEKLEGVNRCEKCIKEGWECWAYNIQGQRNLLNAGARCARCRFRYTTGGCCLPGRKVAEQKLRLSVAVTKPVTTESLGVKPDLEKSYPSRVQNSVQLYLHCKREVNKDSSNMISRAQSTQNSLQYRELDRMKDLENSGLDFEARSGENYPFDPRFLVADPDYDVEAGNYANLDNNDDLAAFFDIF